MSEFIGWLRFIDVSDCEHAFQALVYDWAMKYAHAFDVNLEELTLSELRECVERAYSQTKIETAARTEGVQYD